MLSHNDIEILCKSALIGANLEAAARSWRVEESTTEEREDTRQMVESIACWIRDATCLNAINNDDKSHTARHANLAWMAHTTCLERSIVKSRAARYGAKDLESIREAPMPEEYAEMRERVLKTRLESCVKELLTTTRPHTGLELSAAPKKISFDNGSDTQPLVKTSLATRIMVFLKDSSITSELFTSRELVRDSIPQKAVSFRASTLVLLSFCLRLFDNLFEGAVWSAR